MFMTLVVMTMKMLIDDNVDDREDDDHVDGANEGDLLPLVHCSDRPTGSVISIINNERKKITCVDDCQDGQDIYIILLLIYDCIPCCIREAPLHQ